MYIAVMTRQGKKTVGGVVDEATILDEGNNVVASLDIPRTSDDRTPSDFIEAAGYSPVQWDYQVGNPAAIPKEKLFYNGHNAPLHAIEKIENFVPRLERGVSRYRYAYDDSKYLDSLLVNNGGDTLVVYLHGATSRLNTRLPRFERLATISQMEVSSLYFSDPTLHLHERLELAWYTGWDDQDVQKQIANIVRQTAECLDLSKILVVGASGGGFASLQISALIPGSFAVPINPQTEIENYFIDGDPERKGAQSSYALWVHPEVTTGGRIQPGWSKPLGSKVSTLRRYSVPLENYVLFVQNVNDFHYEQHYLPWLGAAARGENLSDRFRVIEYDGPKGHVAPDTEITIHAIEVARAWADEVKKSTEIDHN